MDPRLSEKVQQVFGPYAVDKREALQAGFERMPRFVTEFLIAKAREGGKERSIAEVRDRIQRFSVDADRKNDVVHRLMRDGTVTLIALLEIQPRPSTNSYEARIAQLDGYHIDVDAALADKYRETMFGGLWGSCTLRYEALPAGARTVLEDFTAFQLTQPDMDVFRKNRSQFTMDEWLDLLVSSAGYRPEAFPTPRHKLLVLSRLVPLVQSNVNMLELGPRGTGKSYLLRNLSSRTYLLAGARATPAALMYDLSRREVGIIGKRKAIVFDEIASTTFSDSNLVAMMKDYMESGQIARAGKSLTSDCSFLFTGNIDLEADGLMPRKEYVHLFEVLPKELCDTAIGDRIHGFIPGWEFPKISEKVLSDGAGLLSDYFGEVLCTLRREVNFDDAMRNGINLEAATQRDKVAVERIGSGFLKMMFPDGQISEEGLVLAASVAVELRQRVHNQLERMAPGEYRPKAITFAGMLPMVAADLAGRNERTEHDVAANQSPQVGKITILYTHPSTGGGGRGFVECALVPGSGLEVVGLRGDALQESVKAAYNALLYLGDKFGLPAERLRRHKVTVHLVDIATPKDGPSAGLAFALAMLSAATNRPVRPGLAVTGELSLMGAVGPVGGIAEKVTAAERAGRTLVLLPAENAGELRVIPDVIGRVHVEPVRTMGEAVALALMD